MSRKERKKKIEGGGGHLQAENITTNNKNYILDWKLEARNLGWQTTNHNEPVERLRQLLEKRKFSFENVSFHSRQRAKEFFC